MNALPALSLLQTRVLGVLVEKEKTVPDIYPLSLNALTSGCNQKNNRDPVLEVAERDVQAAVDELRHLNLLIETSGNRVMRYAHNVGRVLQIPDQAVAIVASLMLRGPQTVSELRASTERLHRFADAGSVEAFLDELTRRSVERGGPLVVMLPKAPGMRESRWAHLLSGPVTMPAADAAAVAAPAASAARASVDDLAEIRAQVDRLSAEVADLRRLLQPLLVRSSAISDDAV